MRRILLTGMSGTGKSTLVGELAARGYQAIDADSDEWSEWRRVDDGNGVRGELDLVWREDRMRKLLATDDCAAVFVAGCAPNQVTFYPWFDHVVLLSAAADVMLDRLASRTTNAYGKQPDELARILELKRTVEPLLRRSADVELDTDAPLDQLVARLLGLLR